MRRRGERTLPEPRLSAARARTERKDRGEGGEATHRHGTESWADPAPASSVEAELIGVVPPQPTSALPKGRSVAAPHAVGWGWAAKGFT
jgi:hypothetical protein